MVKANVHLIRPNQSKPFASVEAAKDGSFEISTDETGLFFVQFTGVSHQNYKTLLFVKKPSKIDLDVRLGAYEYKNSYDGVAIIGDFNDYSFESAIQLKKQGDGTYSAKFKTAKTEFSYQLIKITKNGSSINGTQTDYFEYDGGGDYRSFVKPENGIVRITFDPKKLVTGGTSAEIDFGAHNSDAARFSALYVAMQRRRKSFSHDLGLYEKTGKPIYKYAYDWSPFLNEVSKQLKRERNPLLRKMLLFAYLDLGYGAYGAELNRTLAQQALNEIPPTSPLWQLEPLLVGTALEYAGQTKSNNQYVLEMITKYPDEKIKNRIKKNYSPNRNIMAGKPIPAFTLPSLDKPGVVFTREKLIGKVYFIDFWATWCVPCVEEMDNLHNAYGKYKEKGFEILSLSFDKDPEKVIKFRKRKWKMPWLNSFIVNGFDNKIVRTFEITGLPKPILVNRVGKIIAVGYALRGAKLGKILADTLDK